MTMHIVFQKDHDGYKKDWAGYVERALARRFCRNGIAISNQKHLDNIYDAEQAAIAANKKAKAEKEKVAEKKKAELLKAKEKAKAEKAYSKNAFKRSKAIK